MNLPRAGMAVLAIGTAAYGAAGAIDQTAAQTATLRTIGIVEIPRLFNRFSPDGTLLPPEARLDLLAHPQPGSQVVATVISGDILEAREYGYEETGALVFARGSARLRAAIRASETGRCPPSRARLGARSCRFRRTHYLVLLARMLTTDDDSYPPEQRPARRRG